MHHHFIDRLALLNAFVSASALIPQVWMVLTAPVVAGVSILTFSLIALNSTVWFFYALHRAAWPLMLSSVFNVALSGVIILGVLMSPLS